MLVGAAPTTKPNDFRNEFDYLLVKMAEEKMAEAEFFLAHLTHQIADLEKSKDKALQAQILREINIAVNTNQGALQFLQREAKRTDLNTLEKMNYDIAVAAITTIIKDLQAAGKKVAAIK